MTTYTYPQDRVAWGNPATAGAPFVSVNGRQITVYTDEACTVLAEILDADGQPLDGSTVTVDNDEIPVFRYESDSPVPLYGRPDSGDITTLEPLIAERLTALERGAAAVTPQLATVRQTISDDLRPQLSAITDTVAALSATVNAQATEAPDLAHSVLYDANGNPFRLDINSQGSLVLAPLPTIPAAPATLTVTVNSDKTLNIMFVPSLGGYTLADVTLTATITPDGGGDSVIITGQATPLVSPVLPTGSYTVSVTTTNPKGTSPASSSVTATIADSLLVDEFAYGDGYLNGQGGWVRANGSDVTIRGGRAVLTSSCVMTHAVASAPTHAECVVRPSAGSGMDFELLMAYETVGGYRIITTRLNVNAGANFVDVHSYIPDGTTVLAANVPAGVSPTGEVQITSDLDTTTGALRVQIVMTADGSTAFDQTFQIPSDALPALAGARTIGIACDGGAVEVDRVEFK